MLVGMSQNCLAKGEWHAPKCPNGRWFSCISRSWTKSHQKTISSSFQASIIERCHLFLSGRFCFCLVTNLHFFFSKLSVQVSPTSPKVTANFGYTPQSLTWNLNMVVSKFWISFASGKISRAAMLDFRVDMLMNGRRHRPKCLVVLINSRLLNCPCLLHPPPCQIICR